MRSIRSRRSRNATRNDGSFWLSFSDLMSSLVLIIILILFYIIYQYFDMYEINMAEIARQQYDLDQANATLEEERTKLTAAESQMLAQQIRLNAAEAELQSAEDVLATQQSELSAAQALLSEKETQIATQQAALDALGIQLNDQQAQIYLQQAQLDTQQAKLDDQQTQIEQLVGMKTRIITSLSEALKGANISATVDPASGAIALESDVLFDFGYSRLTEEGRASIRAFLPVYLSVLFSEEYSPYIAEVIIEGHTDNVGSYLDNLELSQKRAGAVASYVLDENSGVLGGSHLRALRRIVTVNGRSLSDLVYDANGNVDAEASRRVVFKFRLTDDQMIQQLKTILEDDGTASE